MPLVSIVTATWNRSNVLRFAIESVLASTVTDWELIVVGDACTDDTEAVVRSFGDPRITFVNLPANSGEQATPNNEGVRRARGEYIAFLNHDDLWAPAHLATCLEAIADADMVWTAQISFDRDDRPHLVGLMPSGRYDPRNGVPASSWLLRRSLTERVGPWRPARELYLMPSQDWIFRASKSGATLRPIPKATVIAVRSGDRARCYADRHETEIAEHARQLASDPSYIARLVEAVAYRLTAEERGSATKLVWRAIKNVVIRAVAATGVHPQTFGGWFRYRRRGGTVDAFRRTRGLSPLPRSESS
jgi:glycosyltransferase involved in cell wall biosynthesis